MLGWPDLVISGGIVSILVFVELALDVLQSPLGATTLEFQSLFSWNLLLMAKMR